MFEWRCALDDALGNDHKVDYGVWWLARSIDGSRLLLIHTLGIADETEYIHVPFVILLLIVVFIVVALLATMLLGLVAWCSRRTLVS